MTPTKPQLFQSKMSNFSYLIEGVCLPAVIIFGLIGEESFNNKEVFREIHKNIDQSNRSPSTWCLELPIFILSFFDQKQVLQSYVRLYKHFPSFNFVHTHFGFVVGWGFLKNILYKTACIKVSTLHLPRVIYLWRIIEINLKFDQRESNWRI